MPKVGFENLGIRLLTPLDDPESEVVEFAVKLKVVNELEYAVAAFCQIQGVHAEGYELTSVTLRGRVEAQSERILTDRSFCDTHLMADSNTGKLPTSASAIRSD